MYIYSVPAQETAKHRAKFGWPPLSDVAAVTKARSETVEICWGAQTPKPIAAVGGPTFTILWGHVEAILLLNRFSGYRYMP